MSGQEDHALPLPELTDFMSEPDAFDNSERLTGPLTATSSGIHSQAHSIATLPEADATNHSHGQSTVAADGVQLVEAATQNATAPETAEEVHGPGGQQPQAASIATQHAAGKQAAALPVTVPPCLCQNISFADSAVPRCGCHQTWCPLLVQTLVVNDKAESCHML